MNSPQAYDVVEDDETFGRCLCIKSSWDDHYLEVMAEENIDSLRLSFSLGWRDSDVGFLSKCHGLRGLEIYSWKVTDLGPAQGLDKLRFLGIQADIKRAFDLSSFPGLRTLKLFWKPKVRGVETLSSLSEMNIVDYPFGDFRPISSLSNLKRIHVTSKILQSFDGLGEANLLRVLDLSKCNRLNDAEALCRLEGLEEIRLANCGQLSAIPPLSNLASLRVMELQECGEQPSLDFIIGCNSLRLLNFQGTNITNGDLSPILELGGLRELVFDDMPHYSIRRRALLGRLKKKGKRRWLF